MTRVAVSVRVELEDASSAIVQAVTKRIYDALPIPGVAEVFASSLDMYVVDAEDDE